jgi:DNA-binding phage protein
MAKRTTRRVSGNLTPEQRRRHQQIRERVEADKVRLTRDAMGRNAELIALRDAMTLLRREREVRGLSLGEVARRTGIDKSRLSKLENDPRSNPTLATLTRIAGAIGVKLSIHVEAG